MNIITAIRAEYCGSLTNSEFLTMLENPTGAELESPVCWGGLVPTVVEVRWQNMSIEARAVAFAVAQSIARGDADMEDLF